MKVQRFLFAGALTGMAMLAAPVLSQNNPRPQPTDPNRNPSTPPGRMNSPSGMSGQGNMQMQVLNPMVGRWDVTVKMFNAEGGAGSSSSTPTSQAQGTSTRSWMVDGKILQEEVRCSGISALSQRTNTGHDVAPVSNELSPQTTPPRPGNPSSSTPPSGQPGESMSETFMGHGMFGYDSKTNEFQHVWCDNTDSKLTMSTGKYDERAKTLTFMVNEMPGMGAGHNSPDTTMPPRSKTPGSPGSPGSNNPGSDNPGMNPDRDNPDRENPELDQVSPHPGTTPPSTTTPPSGQSNNPHMASPGSSSVSMMGLNRVVIRMQSDDKQVVEYYKTGQSSKFMEITYTKSH